jgi:hypothetical protein
LSWRPRARELGGRRRPGGLRLAVVAVIVGLSGARAAASAWGLLAASGARAAGGSIEATEGAQFSGQLVTMTASQCVTAPVTAGPSGSIAWDDGQTSPASYTKVAGTAPPQYTVSGSHTYGEEGDYAGTISSSYTCGGTQYSSTVTFSAQVLDASLSATPGSVTATTGQQFNGPVATFTDADPGGAVGDYSAQINWGDGTAASAGTISAAGGGFTVTGSHTYATAGSYTVTVTISDTGGASAVTHDSASVAANQPPPPPNQHPPVVASFIYLNLGPGTATADASGSVPPGGQAARFIWHVSGAAQPDVVCPGSDPKLTFFTRAALNGAVSLTTVDANSGLSTSTSHALDLSAPKLPKLPFAKHGGAHGGTVVHPSFSILGDCQGLPLPEVLGGRGYGKVKGGQPRPGPGDSPPPACSGQDVQFGAVDAAGCLYELTDLSQLAASDYTPIERILCGKDAYFCAPTPVPRASFGGQVFGASVSSALTPRNGFAGYVPTLRLDYISYSPVRINGLDFAPENGAPIILVPSLDLVVSDNVTVRLAGFPIQHSNNLALYLPDAGGFVGEFAGASKLPIIGSLPFVGGLGVDIHKAGAKLGNGDTCQYDCSSITVHVALPPLFTDLSNNLLTADGVVTADNPTGINLDSLEVQVPHADFAGVGVENVDFSYHRQTDAFHGAATFELAIFSVGGTVDFVHGHFKGASAIVDDLNIPLGEGIFLTELDAGFSLNPTTITGGATVSGGPEVLGTALVSIHAGLVLQIQPFSFDVNGQGSILNQQVGDAHFHVDDQGNISLGGTVDVNIASVFEAKAGLNINVDVPQGHFQADALADVCVFGGCAGGELVISDAGIGACADLGFTHAGGGIQFPSGDVHVFFDSCDIDIFRSIHGVADRLRQAGAAAVPAFTVPAGQRVAVIGLVGQGSSPRATLRGPDGRTIDTPTTPFLKDPNEVVIRDDRRTNTTYFFINHPAAGGWTVTPDPGSAPIVNLEQSHTLPDPSVRASVKLARGGRVVLHYSLVPISGQKVNFAEQAQGGALRLVGTAQGARGTISFRPSDALARGRAIVALVAQDGRPRSDSIVARYTAPAPRALPAPKGLRIRRQGTSVTVSWGRVAGAKGYLLVVHFGDGRDQFLDTRVTQVRIHSILSVVSGRVEVVAYSDLARHHVGRPARASLRSGKQLPKIAIRPIAL